MNKNMRKMYSEQDIADIVEKVTSVEYLQEHAVDITGLPSSGSMETETYANVINRALKSKCVELNGVFYILGFIQDNDNCSLWGGGYNAGVDNSAQSLVINVNKTNKTYQINEYEI